VFAVPGMVGFADVRAGQRTIAVSPGMTIHVRVRAISAPFRVERRLDLADRTPQADEHFGEHVIRLEAQETLAKLYRHVPVAKMVGRADELQAVAGAHFEQRFRGRFDLDDQAVAGEQAVALPSTVPDGRT